MNVPIGNIVITWIFYIVSSLKRPTDTAPKTWEDFDAEQW